MKTMKMVKTVLTGLLIIISSIDGFGAEPAKEKPQTEQSAKNAPQTWMQIVLDDNFSNKGKVWKLAQDIYEDINSLHLSDGESDEMFSIGAGFVEKAGGMTLEAFRKKYGEGKLETTAKGVTYYCFGPLALGFKSGDKSFTWLRAPNRMFREGFVDGAKKASKEK